MKEFLIATWRSAVRERSFALINVLGLALGFACCLLLGLFLYSELTFDRHFDKHSRIYRLAAEINMGGASRQVAMVPRAGAPLAAADNPDIEAYVRFTGASLQDGLRLHHGDKVLNWRRTYFAGDAVFRVFSHQVLAGNPDTALKEPNTVAISQTLARAYFGDENAIGKLLRTDTGESWSVALVFADLPANTHLRYDALFSDKIPLLRDAADQASLQRQLTTGFPAYTYLLMNPGFQPAQWDQFGRAFVDRYIAEDARRVGQSLRILLQPLTGLHYGEPMEDEPSSGNRAYLYGCLTVAVFILLVACINYTNLATARALRRSRAVAIRKILGASRSRLLLECLGEAMLYALVAAVLGLAIAEVAVTLTPIGELLGSQVQFDLSANPALLFAVLGMALVIGLIAGVYPAIYLSAWMPIAAFSTRGGGAAEGARMREILVLAQFVMAVGVVAVTLVMATQMNFVANTPLGFDRDHQVMVTIRGTHNFARVPALSQELRRHPDVLAVAQTTRPPGRWSGAGLARAEDGKGAMQNFQAAYAEVDADFIEALGLELVAGRGFRAGARVAGELVVNESMVRRLGWPEPVGRRIQDGRVIGVVRDFHFRSLREPVNPLLMTLLDDDPGRVPEAQRPFVQRMLIIRTSGQDMQATLKHIEDVMTRFDPGYPFEFTLLDDALQDLYGTERRMLALIAIFAALCILIACLGLFGLTAFDMERRTREIAIRRVLGASSWQVIKLLARRILLLIAIGGVIAALAAWIVMDEWLAGFAYRVAVNPALLVLAVLLAGSVALGTIALQLTRVLRTDPSIALRNE